MKAKPTPEDSAMINACRKVLQTVGGTNPALCAAAHAEALAQLNEALGPFIKSVGGRA